MDEFSIIAKYFAPLSKGEKGAFELTDDAAVIRTAAPGNMVITSDTIVEGVHFLADDPADMIARKLLRVNVSDLIAKGAEPCYYMLNCTFRKGVSEEWIEKFASGLRSDQRAFGMRLIGGDTTATEGTMVFSLTAIGETHKPILRNKAKPGDLVYVTGYIGDSCLGLKVLKKELLVTEQTSTPEPSVPEETSATEAAVPQKAKISTSERYRNYFIEKYYLPEPRVLVGMHLDKVASASIDVSDGLVADVGHICSASGAAAIIRVDSIPLSRNAKAMVRNKPSLRNEIIAHGDDYEIAFTAPKEKASMIDGLAKFAGLPITQVGEVMKGKGVWVVDSKGRPFPLSKTGYKHF